MASIKDIAEKVGVSPSTVSIIINGKAKERKISDKTQEKVLAAMRELNYIPNISAKTIRRGASQEYIVALFCSFDFRNTMMTRLLFGIQKEIKESRTNMKVVIYPYESGQLKKEQAHFTGAGFHAAIIANANSDDLNFLSHHQFSFPVVLYNRILAEYGSVNVNDDEIGRSAAKHLFENGYRRPAVLCGSSEFPGSSSRTATFCATMQEFGINISDSYIFQVGNSMQASSEFAEQLIVNQDFVMPDSFWCASDNMALGLMNTLASNGINIPSEMGIISVGNIEPMFSRYNNPSLTVIDIPIEQMGAGCYELVKRCIDNPLAAPERIFFETRLYNRDSTNTRFFNQE